MDMSKVDGRRDRQDACPTLRASLVLSLAAFLLAGCATETPQCRAFDFARDTFAYRNELVWAYQHDPVNRKTEISRREPRPDYTQRCFVVSRAARQFFDHASFDATKSAADEKMYRRLVRKVMSRSARSASSERERVVIPGYADLRGFSRDWEGLLKEESGGPWRSYLQCGNWRMILPFTRGQQQRTAEALARHLKSGRPQIAHLVRFPQLTINHALVVYDSKETDHGRTFLAYDPNDNLQPIELVYDGARRWFLLGPNDYFAGGPVNVYPAYQGWCY
jgi:hypothetical protein